MHTPRRACRAIPMAAATVLISLSLATPTAHAANVLVDFGSAATPTAVDTVGRTWTNVTDGNDQSGNPFTLLSTSNGADTGYRLSVSNPAGVTNPLGFNGSNTNGTLTPTGAALTRNYPVTATQDSLFGNTVANLTGLAGISPDANNQITIDIDPGPNNNNASGFFYLGVLDLTSTPASVPEPSAPAALATTVTAALATLRRRRRKPASR